MQANEMSESGHGLGSLAEHVRGAQPRRNETGAPSSTAWLLAALGVGSVAATFFLRQSARTHGAPSKRFKFAGAATAGATLIDALVLVSRRKGFAKRRVIAVKTSVTIRRSAEDLYRYWRELRNLPSFMRHVDSVSEVDGHSVWRARGPGAFSVQWEAEIVGDRPGERIAWRSLEGATVPNHGSVEFRPAPGERGTEVHLEIGFEPPGGAVGAGLSRLFGKVPKQSLENDLRRLKQMMETGEIARSDASIHRGKHPARPPNYQEMPLVNGMVRS